jgi:ComEC/Rec2-related protein
MFSFRYPAVVVLTFVIVGTLLGWKIDPGLPVLIALVVASFIFLLYGFFRLPRKYFIFPLAALAMAATFLSAGMKYHLFPPDDIGCLTGCREQLRFFGRIDKWPVIKRHKTLITCCVDSIAVNDSIRPASGSILMNIRRETTRFSLGDQISFTGRLGRPHRSGYPGGFDYSRYLFNRGIRGTVYISNPLRIMVHQPAYNLFGRAISYIRQWILECFRNNLTEIPASLASGFLIGETRDIPEDIYQAFRRTGTMHLLAVSGSNVALVLLVMVFLLRFFPMKRSVRLMVLLAIIVAFSHLSYNQPSVVRASLTAALILAARFFYRRTDLNNIIAATAAILIICNPGNLFDIGFQLSFAVAWALILFLPQVNYLFESFKMRTPVRYLLLIASSSLIASLTAAPITSYYFGQTSLVTVFSNLVIVPLVSLAVIGIVTLLLVNLALPAAAIVPGIMLDRLLNVTHYLVGWFGRWKIAAASPPSFPAVYVYVILIAVTLLFLSIRYRCARRLGCFFVLLIAVSCLAVDIFASPYLPDMEIFNHDTSSAIIINRAGGIVIYHQDGENRYDDFTGNLLPYLAGRRSSLPQYFVFMEPAYRTERRLNRACEIIPRIKFKPVEVEIDLKSPTIWRTFTGDYPAETDSSRIIRIAPGIVVVEPENFRRLVFSKDIEMLKSLREPDSGYLTSCFLLAGRNRDLAEAASQSYCSQYRVLLERSLESYNMLSDSEIERIQENLFDNLIERGEHSYYSFEDLD